MEKYSLSRFGKPSEIADAGSILLMITIYITGSEILKVKWWFIRLKYFILNFFFVLKKSFLNFLV